MAKKLIASAQITITTVSDGANGSNGVGVKNTDVMYIITSSNITPPSKTDPNWKTTADTPTVSKPYVWSMIKTTLTNNTTTLSEPVCISGQGVTNIIEQYAMSKDKVNHPAENSSEWKEKQPVWQSGYFIWTRSKVTYKNPDKIEYINYYCDSSWQAIEDVEVGGRNLLLKTGTSQDIVCNNDTNKTGAFYKFSINIDEELKGKKITFAYDWEYQGSTPKGTLRAQTAGPLYYSLSDVVTIAGNKGTTKKTLTIPTGGETATQVCIRTDNVVGTITISKMRLFYGDKDLGWIAAPEDKTDSDNIIGDINGSEETGSDGNPLQISAKKINIKGEVTFESLNKSSDEFGSMFEKDKGKTIIDGGYIKTKSVQAESMNVYRLTVSKRKNKGTAENPIWEELTNEAPTFMIAEDGNISASGTFKSFNFKEDPNNPESNQGWMIDKDGNSVFNNTIVRGKVELPNAGVTNEGTANTSVRFWAGESYQKRDQAPFKVLQDGTIISKRGEFGGTFTGEIQIGNIRISDKIGNASNPSWGIIEIKNDSNSETVVKIGEQSSCFNSSTYFGPEVMSTDMATSTIKILPKEKSMKIQCVPLTLSSYDTKTSKESKTTILGSSIDFNNKYKLQTDSTNTKIELKGTEAKSEFVLQNESLNSQFNLSVHGFGDFKEGVVIGGIKIQPAPDSNGIDFFAVT